jgi:uncharacterized protein
MNLDVIRPQLRALCAQHPIRLVYLFGSHASGHTHAESDVDIAVLLDEALTTQERSAEQLALIGAFSRLWRTDNVDVTILNEASPLLAYEVLRNGVLLYCVDDEVRVEFQVRTLRAYEDTAPLRTILAEAMAERLKAGTFGKAVCTKHG